MNQFKAAVIQIRGNRDVDGNLESAGHWLDQACAEGARLVVLPENFAYWGRKNLGEVARPERTAEGPARRFLADKAREHGIWLVGGTVPIGDGDRPNATTLLFGPTGAEVARYHKIHLFDVLVAETGKSYRESDEYRHGSEVVVADTEFCPLGLSVCYDLRFPELYRRMMLRGAEIMAVPSAFTAATGRAHWELLLRARAVENLSYALGANMVDREHPSNPTWGGSAIIDPWGRVLASLAGEEGYAVAEIDLQALRKLRRTMPALDHRRLGIE